MMYAKYTIVLKTLLDNPESKALIDEAMSTYPLFLPKNPENHTIIPTREEINKKILDHYKYREIGFETFGRWLDELEIALNEIMPYYNQLFNSEDIINGLEDIFGNLDVLEEFEQESSNQSTESSEGSESVEGSGNATSQGNDSSTNNSSIQSSSKHIKSDTPQSQLTISADNIDSVKYANEVAWNKDGSTNSATSSGTTSSETTSSNSQDITRSGNVEGTSSGTTKHSLHRKGNQGVNTYAHDMLEFRDLFMNVVQKIIHDPRIEELFMGVY